MEKRKINQRRTKSLFFFRKIENEKKLCEIKF